MSLTKAKHTLFILGNQPPGQMDVSIDKSVDCAGYNGCGTVKINYHFPSGMQMVRQQFKNV
jgi:hypothetical protein